MLVEVLTQAGLGFAALEAIVVTRGPGGFTGVRIGLATARGLGLALGCPVLGLSNFEVLAAAVPHLQAGRTVVAAIGAKRAEIYVQTFLPSNCEAGLAAAGAGRSLLPAALDSAVPPGPVLLIGDGAEIAASALGAAGRTVEIVASEGLCLAAVAARLAAGRPLPPPDAAPASPIYLRGADVTLPDGRKAQAPP